LGSLAEIHQGAVIFGQIIVLPIQRQLTQEYAVSVACG